MTQFTKSHSDYDSSAARWRAIVNRDPAATCFVYGVRTTKIYCRPSCPARLARRANVEFYDTPKQAEDAAYRPCKRCKPEELLPPADPHIRLAQKACETLTLAALAGENASRPTLQDLAAEAALTPSHFHRVFKKVVGITPGKYARGVAEGKAMEQEVNRGFEPSSIGGTPASRVEGASMPTDISAQVQHHEVSQGLESYGPLPIDWNEVDTMLADATSAQRPFDKFMGDGFDFAADDAFDWAQRALFDDPALSSADGSWVTAAPVDVTGNTDHQPEFTSNSGNGLDSADKLGRPTSDFSTSSLGSLSAPKTPIDFDPYASLAEPPLLPSDLSYMADTVIFPEYDSRSGPVQFLSGL